MSRRSDKLARELATLEGKAAALDTEREGACVALRDIAERELRLGELALAVELEERTAEELEREREAVASARARVEGELRRLDVLGPPLERRTAEKRHEFLEARAEDAERAYLAAREPTNKLSGSIAEHLRTIAAERLLLESARDETDATRVAWVDACRTAGLERPGWEEADDEPLWADVGGLLERGPRRPFEREAAGLARGREESRRRRQEEAEWRLHRATVEVRQATRRELEQAAVAGDAEAAEILRIAAAR